LFLGVVASALAAALGVIALLAVMHIQNEEMASAATSASTGLAQHGEDEGAQTTTALWHGAKADTSVAATAIHAIMGSPFAPCPASHPRSATFGHKVYCLNSATTALADKTDAECKAAGHLSSCGQECCRYCDDIGCCDSDTEGRYCKSKYDAKKKEMEEQVKNASCGDCKDCSATKVAQATGEPTADCAMVKAMNYCPHAMGMAMCPVTCDDKCTKTTGV